MYYVLMSFVLLFQELQHLFDKLDVDGDGRVSFQEFLHGLFQHGSPATPSTPGRSLSTPRSKLRMAVAGDDRIQTPSFFSTGSGLFSVLDTENSGYDNYYHDNGGGYEILHLLKQ